MGICLWTTVMHFFCTAFLPQHRWELSCFELPLVKMKQMPLGNTDLLIRSNWPVWKQRGTPKLSNGAWFACPWAGQSRLECNPGNQRGAWFECSKPTSLPQWFDCVGCGFSCWRAGGVEPPPHPSSNDVGISWRQFGWHVCSSPCWEPHGSVVSWSTEVLYHHNNPCLCLSTAIGFHLKTSLGILVTPENPPCASKWKWALQDHCGPWIPLSTQTSSGLWTWKELYCRTDGCIATGFSRLSSKPSFAMAWNNVCLGKQGNCWLKKSVFQIFYKP